MKKMILIAALFAASASVATFTGCKKDDIVKKCWAIKTNVSGYSFTYYFWVTEAEADKIVKEYNAQGWSASKSSSSKGVSECNTVNY
ncbi:MAG: hypothetical protein LBN27_06730 [Prevotellaceae bacterium]|nr:hypothetical protein [Prevotellaceae bacterium]